MRRLILGTAGHIDHGKTALVRALTGVDTDRLKEEKERGITIELGFAELEAGPDLTFGVVDVPGHEGFVRAMVAGATGMDLVLLVVAADEGVMPQTREHLAIVRLLGVERLAVALTKVDLIEDEWLDLVTEDVRELLASTRYAEAPIVPTSASVGTGLGELKATLRRIGEGARGRDSTDLPRLPVDRVFTVRGTGTVVTGTLWSGTLTKGQRIRVEPGGPAARIRGLEVHGEACSVAEAGARTAVALVGPDVGRGGVRRGQSIVGTWPPSSMLSVEVTLLPSTGWQLEHGQRVRVHAGTAEVLARCVIPSQVVTAGQTDWVQLRLEEPVVTRARDPLIIRSYSPVTTIGGAVVAEPHPAKRSRFEADELTRLVRILRGDPPDAVGAVLEQAGWRGADVELLPVATGLRPDEVEEATEGLIGAGAVYTGGRLFAAVLVQEAETILERAVAVFHRQNPLQRGIPLEILRQALPHDTPSVLSDAVLQRLEEDGRLRVGHGVASIPTFELVLSAGAAAARDRLRDLYRVAGVAPPALRDLPTELRSRADFDSLLGLLVDGGDLTVLDQDLYAWTTAVQDTVSEILGHFGGRSDLSPADFREVVKVSRKHLMPLLAYLDGIGVTTRVGDVRSVTLEPDTAPLGGADNA